MALSDQSSRARACPLLDQQPTSGGPGVRHLTENQLVIDRFYIRGIEAIIECLILCPRRNRLPRHELVRYIANPPHPTAMPALLFDGCAVPS